MTPQRNQLSVLTTIMEKLASLKHVHLGGELPATRVHPFGTHCPFEFKYTLHCVLVTVSCNKKNEASFSEIETFKVYEAHGSFNLKF